MKKRVIGVGGVFFKYENPEQIRSWYSKHLGLNTDDYGCSFEWRKADKPEEKGFTLWSAFKKESDYFGSEKQQAMINFRVENLAMLLEEFKKEGVKIVGELQEYEYGKFAHIEDPEGNRIELWEAVDGEYDKMIGEARNS